MSQPASPASSSSEEKEWVSDLCDCFTYRTESERLRFSPIFMPCSCFCPCVMMGRIKSRLINEPHTGCCHMGSKGRCYCLGSCCLFPCLPLFSMNIRQRTMNENNVPGGCFEEWKGCFCCACSLFQIFVSLDEWNASKKTSTGASSRHSSKVKKSRAKVSQQQKKPTKDVIPPVLPTQQNEMTQLVMTYMGDIMDESDEDYDTDDENEEEFDIVDLNTNSNNSSNNNNKNVPAKQNGNDQSLDHVSVLQVTIPPGHFAGSVFEIENSLGQILEVVVPAGGKPGMKMQVPNKAPSPPLPSPPPSNQQSVNPVVVQDGNLQVAIPPNHFAGDMFYIQSSRGDVMEVVVPVGGKPGMKMQIPNTFSQLLTRPEPPVPPRRNSPPPPGGEEARQHKPLLPKDDSKKKKKKLNKQKSGASTRSTSPSGAKVIQVTIPEGCYEGAIFELRPTNGTGDNIKVRVPKGGRPGLRVQIRVPSQTQTQTQPQPQPQQQEKKNTPLRKQQPVMRDSPKSKDSKATRNTFDSKGGNNKQLHTASVAVPQGVSAGEPFVALDVNTGQQVLVIMPKGAVPGTVIDTTIVHDN